MTLAFVDERLYLIVTQLVLPLHECATESDADPATAEATTIESATKPLHSAADPAGSTAALTETFYVCVHV
jgi:hypothetical protein